MCNVCSTVVEKANDVEENPGPTIYDVVDPQYMMLLTQVKQYVLF